jgi:hypothetical protein
VRLAVACDMADAEAICETAQRFHGFVALMSEAKRSFGVSRTAAH